jgi:hypothetical protein
MREARGKQIEEAGDQGKDGRRRTLAHQIKGKKKKKKLKTSSSSCWVVRSGVVQLGLANASKYATEWTRACLVF